MNKFIKSFVFVVLIASKALCVSEAGAVFLLINPGASAQGTGEAQVAKADDAYASYYNPAGLGYLKGNEIVFQHVNWLPNLANDIYFDFIAFRRSLGHLGTLGGHLIYLNLGSQDETNVVGEVLGQFRSYMTALTIGYATTLSSPNKSIGFNFKVFHQRLAEHGVSNEGQAGGSDEGASTDIAFDLGYLQKFGKKKQHGFGFAIQNIGPPIDFVDAEQADPAPTNMKIGFNFELQKTETSQINFLFDMNKLLVAAYPAMDWDGDGIISGEKEFAHKDDWYKGVFTAWLDDWYYGGDYDYDMPSNLDYDLVTTFWRDDPDSYADGIIGGFEERPWQYVHHELVLENGFEIGDHNDTDWDVNLVSDYVYVPNYSGFCENEYKAFSGYSRNDQFQTVPDYYENQNGDTEYYSMCYDSNGLNYDPSLGGDDVQSTYLANSELGYLGHAWIDMPDDGFGAVDNFDASCDPLKDYDCTVYSNHNNNQVGNDHDGDGQNDLGFDFDGDGVPEVFGDDIVDVDNQTYTRLDVPYDGNLADGRGEYAFDEINEDGLGYGYYNPYGKAEKDSGKNRSFQSELEEVIYNFGFEYKYNNNFTMRLGFIYDLEGDIKNPTLGAGIKFNQYGFDFGYTSGETGHPRANTMFFSLSIET